MTINQSRLREWYENEPEASPYRKATDAVVDAVIDGLRKSGLKAAGDDRAENLVTAVFGYILESNNVERL